MPSAVEKWASYYNGQQDASQAAPSSDPGFIGGFISSAISAIPETFGSDPFPTATEFRQAHPIAGVGSELLGGSVPYILGGEAAATEKGVALLDNVMARTGLDAAASPIKYGAARLALTFAPVELSRLGVGLFTTDDWNKYKGLMLDVGLSTALTGGLGGFGGFLRSAGPKKLGFARVAQAPEGLAAPFEYRLSFADSAQTTNKAVPLSEVQQKLFQETFTERPMTGRTEPQAGRRVRERAVGPLEGSDQPSAPVAVSVLFGESKPGATKGLIRRTLMQPDGTWTLGEDGTNEVLGALGFKGLEGPDGLAQAGRLPTIVDIGGPRALGTFKKAVEPLSPVADGVVMGREANGGLFIVGKRLKAGEVPEAGAEAKPATLQPYAAGDRWFFIKTDKPQLFAPKTAAAGELAFNQFAKMRGSFRPEYSPDSFFNSEQNKLLKIFTPQDIVDIRRGMPADSIQARAVQRIVSGANSEFTRITGIDPKNSEMLNNMVKQAYKVIVPPQFMEGHNSLYSRLFSMLRLNKESGETLVNKMLGGAAKVGRRSGFGVKISHEQFVEPGGPRTLGSVLDEAKPSPEDIRLVYDVGNSQNPKETLAELTKNGLVSPAALKVMDGLEALDKHYWGKMLPIADDIGMKARFSLLSGPYVPKLYRGDNFVPVYAEDGKTLKFLASGNRLEAAQQAKAFVDEGAKMGLTYKMGSPTSWYKDEMVKLHLQMQEALLRDPNAAKVAQAAMKRLAIENAGKAPSGMLKPGLPKTLSTERGGVMGSPDLKPVTSSDLLTDVQSHYAQVSRYLGYQSWLQRWMPETLRLQKQAPEMYSDLVNRGRQMLGYSGESGRFLDKKLSKVLGPILGGKAATTIARQTNELFYHWNIGIINPTFALVNLLTPLQTVAPWIALMKQAPEAADDLMHTHFRFGEDGKPRGVFNTLSVPKLMMKALRELGSPGDQLMEHLGRAKTDGSLSPQLYETFVGRGSQANQGIREAFNQGPWEGIKSIATWGSRHSEEWSREYAFSAGHVVGRDVMGLEGDELYRFAQRATHVTMYGYHAMDRSMMFTGPLGSMFGLFKNWQMHFIGSMMQYAGLAWKDNIWGPLLWQFAGSMAIGGLGATPLVLAADKLAKWNDDSPNSYAWMKQHWHNAADEVYYGLPALFGVSLQASAALPGTDVQNDLSMLSNFVFLERAKAAWKATAGAYEYAEQTGQNPLKNPNVRDGLLQGYAPRALFRLFSTTEDNAILSMSTGYPMVRDVSPIGKMAYQLGLNPIEIEKQQDVAKNLWNDQQAQRAAIQAWGDRFAQAELKGDTEEMNYVIGAAIAQGLPMSSIASSAQTRLRRERQGDLLTKFGPNAEMARQILQP